MPEKFDETIAENRFSNKLRSIKTKFRVVKGSSFFDGQPQLAGQKRFCSCLASISQGFRVLCNGKKE